MPVESEPAVAEIHVLHDSNNLLKGKSKRELVWVIQLRDAGSNLLKEERSLLQEWWEFGR